jgi:CxxC motif-containing protein
MEKKLVCIICPNGCELSMVVEGKEIKSIEGASCEKGEDYAYQEITDPRRTIATLVKVKDGELPLVSVRTTNPIPKDKIFEVVDQIKKLEVTAPVYINQVIVANIANLGSDIIATKIVQRN